MDEEMTARLRALSKTVFGQAYRLEVMLAVANNPDGLVNLTDIAAALKTSTSNVQKPLQSLVEAGLLVEGPRGSDRRRHLIRRDSSAWAWALELYQLVTPNDQTHLDWTYAEGSGRS